LPMLRSYPSIESSKPILTTFSMAPRIWRSKFCIPNTMSEINDREKLCLENGAREFWIVDPDLRQVESLAAGRHHDNIPRRAGDFTSRF